MLAPFEYMNLQIEDLNPTPPTSSDDEYMECTMHELVANDKFYEEVESRLEDPNERDESGYTLLHAATWSSEDNSRILQLLLDRKAVVDSTTQYGHTPLHIAVACRKRNAVTALIDAGASVNSKDAFGRTVLHFAIGAKWSYPPIPKLNLPCDMWIVERLLSHPDIDLDPVNNAGSTPLMWAVRTQNSDAVRALLKKGADPNIPNMNNRTPLHVALSSRNPSISIVCALLSKGVGIYCKDRFGRTPMDVFIRNLPADDVAQHVVWSIVLRYRVRESLVRELKKIPRLYKYYVKCHEELTLMMSRIVYEKFTLHDFVYDCFPLDFEEPVMEIFMYVVETIVSGSYTVYSNLIRKCMRIRD